MPFCGMSQLGVGEGGWMGGNWWGKGEGIDLQRQVYCAWGAIGNGSVTRIVQVSRCLG